MLCLQYQVVIYTRSRRFFLLSFLPLFFNIISSVFLFIIISYLLLYVQCSVHILFAQQSEFDVWMNEYMYRIVSYRIVWKLNSTATPVDWFGRHIYSTTSKASIQSVARREKIKGEMEEEEEEK